MERVKEFHIATDQPVGVEPNMADMLFRAALIREESRELKQALHGVCHYPCGEDKKALAHLLKEMCDVIYVIKGTAVTFGWDLDEAYKRVCDNNMTKVTPYRKDPVTGKVLKPDNYKPVELEDLV